MKPLLFLADVGRVVSVVRPLPFMHNGSIQRVLDVFHSLVLYNQFLVEHICFRQRYCCSRLEITTVLEQCAGC